MAESEETILLHPDPRTQGGRGCLEVVISLRTNARRSLKQCGEQLFRRSNLLLLSLLVLQVSVLVLQKSITIRMANYPYVLAQTQPMCTTVLFMIVYVIGDAIQRKQKVSAAGARKLSPSSDGFRGPSPIDPLLGPSIQRDARPVYIPFPKWKFFVMGLLFTLSNFMVFAGNRGPPLLRLVLGSSLIDSLGNLVSGPIAILILQAVVPFTFALSFVFLNVRYHLLHYLGALAILGGIFFSLWPQIADLVAVADAFWAILLLFGSAASTAAAVVFMEHSFKRHNMPLLYAWVWINIFEIFAAIPLVFAIIPIQGIPISGIGWNVLDGYMCLAFGHNSTTGDECSYVLALYLSYVFALVANKVNLSYVIKNNSSTLMWVIVTSALPLANLAFCLPQIMGAHAVPFNPFALGGLGIVLLGILLYRSTKEVQLQDDDAAEEKSWWFENPPPRTPSPRPPESP